MSLEKATLYASYLNADKDDPIEKKWLGFCENFTAMLPHLAQRDEQTLKDFAANVDAITFFDKIQGNSSKWNFYSTGSLSEEDTLKLHMRALQVPSGVDISDEQTIRQIWGTYLQNVHPILGSAAKGESPATDEVLKLSRALVYFEDKHECAVQEKIIAQTPPPPKPFNKSIMLFGGVAFVTILVAGSAFVGKLTDQTIQKEKQSKATVEINIQAREALKEITKKRATDEAFRMNLQDLQKNAETHNKAEITGTPEEIAHFSQKVAKPYYYLQDEAFSYATGRTGLYDVKKVNYGARFCQEVIPMTSDEISKLNISPQPTAAFKIVAGAVVSDPSRIIGEGRPYDKRASLEDQKAYFADAYNDVTAYSTVVFMGPNGTKKVVYGSDGKVIEPPAKPDAAKSKNASEKQNQPQKAGQNPGKLKVTSATVTPSNTLIATGGRRHINFAL